MELNQIEFSRLIETTTETEQLNLLDDLQLALVGGGIGETVL